MGGAGTTDREVGKPYRQVEAADEEGAVNQVPQRVRGCFPPQASRVNSAERKPREQGAGEHAPSPEEPKVKAFLSLILLSHVHPQLALTAVRPLVGYQHPPEKPLQPEHLTLQAKKLDVSLTELCPDSSSRTCSVRLTIDRVGTGRCPRWEEGTRCETYGAVVTLGKGASSTEGSQLPAAAR